MKKKITAKTDALYCALFRKKMAIKSQKVYKRARKKPESTGFIATSKLQPTKKLEKVTKCCTAENSYQDVILD